MNAENTLFYIFGGEVLIVTTLLAVILIGKFLTFFSAKHRKRVETKLSKLLSKAIIEGTSLGFKFKFYDFHHLSILLSVCENFDHRIKGREWEELKNDISRRFLINKARRWSRSSQWIKRNFSARVFALTPFLEDEQDLLKLMDDKVFLVRGSASIGAVKREIKESVHKVLEHMSGESGYSYYFYKDLLLEGSLQIQLFVEEFASKKKSLSFHIACLDVLKDTYMPLEKFSLEKDFESESKALRLAAIKVYSNNPQANSYEVLKKALIDPDPAIRTEAVQGLAAFYGMETAKDVSPLLSDEDLHVRVQSAITLNKLGKEGRKILHAQDPNANIESYEAAQYALQFTEGI